MDCQGYGLARSASSKECERVERPAVDWCVGGRRVFRLVYGRLAEGGLVRR